MVVLKKWGAAVRTVVYGRWEGWLGVSKTEMCSEDVRKTRTTMGKMAEAVKKMAAVKTGGAEKVRAAQTRTARGMIEVGTAVDCTAGVTIWKRTVEDGMEGVKMAITTTTDATKDETVHHIGVVAHGVVGMEVLQCR